ncbi:heme A synthase [uncultured Nocardioides sp.]|uniref:COX15/CtaA family protein n=1 Tax=uncultured Nocardioides sp. TaxID=198441 RepID=UPI0025D25B98|nr:COX15/CtaA family protein [uncultured Nocardioides sp.]
MSLLTESSRRPVGLPGRLLWPLAVTNLVVNILIVVTGGAVRLTGSGLGCPTWPRCTEDSFVAHGELGLHGAIEFGNRLLTFVLVVVALACLVAALAAGHRAAVRLSALVAVGIAVQALIGGLTVLIDLNPWVVSVHLLVSMAIIAACTVLLDAVRGPGRPAASALSGRLAWSALAAAWVVLALGTVVTGSGPHSGDVETLRTGIDPAVMSHVHAIAVYVLVALTMGVLGLARRAGEDVVARAAGVLLGVELAQGAVGFAQYWLDLPELLVAVHLLGAAVLSAAVTWLVLSVRARAGR